MKLSKDARRFSRELFQMSFTEGRLDEGKVGQIARKVAETKPREYLNILKDYHRLLRMEVGKHHAVVETATVLDGGVREQLEVSLRQKYGSDLTFEFLVQPELIGGLRVKIGSDVYDSSVRERLHRLGAALAGSR